MRGRGPHGTGLPFLLRAYGIARVLEGVAKALARYGNADLRESSRFNIPELTGQTRRPPSRCQV